MVTLKYGVQRTLCNLLGNLLAIILLTFTPNVAAAEERVVIAALGDSLIQGYGLPLEDGFVPQLNDWLEQKGANATVINAGVSGDTTAGGLARLDWTLGPEVEGLIVALGGNDLLRGIAPEIVAANLDAILAGASAKGLPVLLVAQRAAANYGAQYQADFDAIYPMLAAKYQVPMSASFLSLLSQTEGDLNAIRPYLQGDNIHPNATGVAMIVSEIGPDVLRLVHSVSD